MTRAEKAIALRDRLEQARADALEVSGRFDTLIEAARATPKQLDEAAQAVILAAAEVRMAARAVVLDTPRGRAK